MARYSVSDKEEINLNLNFIISVIFLASDEQASFLVSLNCFDESRNLFL